MDDLVPLNAPVQAGTASGFGRPAEPATPRRFAQRALRGTSRLRRGLLGLCALLVLQAALVPPARAVEATRLALLPQHWRDDQGKSMALTDLAGHRVVLTMAYADCHKICPMTIERLKQLQKQQDAQGESLDIVVVGYDPQTDDPAAWHHYRLHHKVMRPNWHFLTGSVKDTQQFANQLGFEFWKLDEHVMHDARVVAFSADGTFVGELDESDLNADLARHSQHLP